MDLVKLRKFYNLLLRLKLESDDMEKFEFFWAYYGVPDKLIYEALDYYNCYKYYTGVRPMYVNMFVESLDQTLYLMQRKIVI
jgi:hypothetical protein